MKKAILIAIAVIIAIIVARTLTIENKTVNAPTLQARPEPVLRLDRQELNKFKEQIDKEKKAIANTRQVTAYNLVEWQTDGSPCIGASGDNLCELLDKGIKVCAANFVKLGTILEISSVGRCIVLDRTASKHKNRVDIAMKSDEVHLARNFGVKRLEVKIINYESN